jgi:hypothetical protein
MLYSGLKIIVHINYIVAVNTTTSAAFIRGTKLVYNKEFQCQDTGCVFFGEFVIETFHVLASLKADAKAAKIVVFEGLLCSPHGSNP